MKWFGESWYAPICTEANHVKTPSAKCCAYCEAPIQKTDQGVMYAYTESDDLPWKIDVYFEAWHLDCFLKHLGILEDKSREKS